MQDCNHQFINGIAEIQYLVAFFAWAPRDAESSITLRDSPVAYRISVCSGFILCNMGFQGGQLFGIIGRFEQQKWQKSFLVLIVGARTFLQRSPELPLRTSSTFLLPSLSCRRGHPSTFRVSHFRIWVRWRSCCCRCCGCRNNPSAQTTLFSQLIVRSPQA